MDSIDWQLIGTVAAIIFVAGSYFVFGLVIGLIWRCGESDGADLSEIERVIAEAARGLVGIDRD